MAEAVEAAGIENVEIRSVLTCRSEQGVCVKCYGMNLATGHSVRVGEAAGTIAAQAIGEPGTQLTMRTFHTGGVAQTEDITQGLPRVEELFEARKPKDVAIITEIAGKVSISKENSREITVSNEDGEAKTYTIPFDARARVEDGQKIEAGAPLNSGSINPHDILKINGIKGVQEYLLNEVQTVYRLQGVETADKHIEVILRQMMRKVKIDEIGDTDMLPGSLVDIFEFETKNEQVMMDGGEPASAQRILLGITKASLATNSFLSAAAFQETTRVLTDAAIKGKVDPLVGLKENIIIGKLIPAGTGIKKYNNIAINTEYAMPEDDEVFDEDIFDDGSIVLEA